jgi:hypothetical protein
MEHMRRAAFAGIELEYETRRAGEPQQSTARPADVRAGGGNVPRPMGALGIKRAHVVGHSARAASPFSSRWMFPTWVTPSPSSSRH